MKKQTYEKIVEIIRDRYTQIIKDRQTLPWSIPDLHIVSTSQVTAHFEGLLTDLENIQRKEIHGKAAR
jgi:hypothetical protein